ncbi:Gfo/Idh/MocA family protein [Vibrio nitrifigilis]|uniref:Gfo/Idh/MocA family oxidoreductase n=1 Tax=Vibrio nitrifigilis TaxID=2789781 RepID=A0ABS0GD48_9VIBR|nr:Gfo/Idh/MocA family oxidoreductase [Vibrio nitrifigilis]MBF9000348.1 Gfo/Idh/MocA family oxidoreductase [Vibrio nitrifigilis]
MRIGLVGYGTGGQYFHAPFIEAAQDLELTGIVARSPAKLAAIEQDFPDMPVFDSLTSMIQSGTVDAVTISTPPETRRDLVLEAIEAGLHVVADKPFAPNAEVAKGLFDAAKKKGVVLCAFHNRRFDTDVRTLRKAMDEGRLGKIWRMHSRLDCDDPDSLEPGPTGGLLRDLGSHVVDQAVYLLGSVKSVYAHIDEVELPQGTTNASFVLTLQHESGATSYVSASKLNHVQMKEFIVYGEKGSMQSQMSDVQANALFAGERPVNNIAQWGVEEKVRWPILRTAQGDVAVPSEQGAYFAYYNQFAKAVSEGAELPVPPEQVVQVLKILDGAIISAKENRVVTID